MKQRLDAKQKLSFAYDDYRTYIKRANKHDLIIDELKQKLQSYEPSGDIYAILDMGCGDGLLSARIIQRLINIRGLVGKKDNFVFDMVDPDKNILAELKDKLDKFLQKNTLVRYFEYSLEDYLLNYSPPKHYYDGILCSHVFYHVEDWENSIPGLMNLVRPGGWFCIVLVSDDADLYRLRVRLAPLLANCHLVEADGRYVFGKDIEHFLITNSIKFKKSVRDSSITLTRLDLQDEDVVYRTLGFLFRYRAEDLREYCADEIKEFLVNKLDRQGDASLKYKDEFFWIERRLE